MAHPPDRRESVDNHRESLSSEEDDRFRDDTLRNMLRTKPQPHQEMKRSRRKGSVTDASSTSKTS